MVVVQGNVHVDWEMEIVTMITNVLVHCFVEVMVEVTMTTVLGEIETTAAWNQIQVWFQTCW